MRIPGHVHFTRALVFVYDIPDIRTFYLSASVNSHMISCVIFGTSLLFAFYDLFKSLAACVNIRRVKVNRRIMSLYCYPNCPIVYAILVFCSRARHI